MYSCNVCTCNFVSVPTREATHGGGARLLISDHNSTFAASCVHVDLAEDFRSWMRQYTQRVQHKLCRESLQLYRLVQKVMKA
jgi:hypothetical protein